MIVSDSMMQKVDMPGLWFLKSNRPLSDISDLIYELSVKGCAHFFVRSQFKREIQKDVLAKVMKDFLDEHKEHGFFFYPEELNDYVENGYFWCDTVILMDDLHEIGNYSNDIIILEDMNDLHYEDETDLLKILQLNHVDAIRHRDTMVVLVQEENYGPASDFIETHLFN